MNKDVLIKKVIARLRDNDIRKNIKSSRTSIKVLDEYGNSKSFPILIPMKSVLYTANDCEAIIDAVIEVVIESIRNNEDVSIPGFGRLYLNYAKGRFFLHPQTGVPSEVPSRFSVKFKPGKDLQVAAALYTNDIFPKKENVVSEADAIFDCVRSEGGDM